MSSREITCSAIDGGGRARFSAMASPCEVLVESDDPLLLRTLAQAVANEAWRIETAYSRYRDDNIIHAINHAGGKPVRVDEECARLIDFADQLYRLSDGLFDITSGVLRRVWRFDGGDRLPEPEAVTALLDKIGWRKASWRPPELRLPAGMEIDLGGIGKEYAVDRCVQIARQACDVSVLVNFGGDLAVSRPRREGRCWSVGRLVTGKDQPVAVFQLYRGAIATSGDANRYLLKDGKRYSHVLNPKTGWPVENPPHTVSVAAPTCVEAGMLSTLAMLHGAEAEAFLQAQEVDYWLD